MSRWTDIETTRERLARACIVDEYGPEDVGLLDYLRQERGA